MRVRSLPFLIACALATPSGFCLAEAATPSSSVNSREAPPTHVIGFVAGDHFDQAEALTRAIRKSIELSTSQRLAAGDFSLEVLTAALGCPEKPDAACLKKISTKISSRRFLWGSLTVEGTRVDAELQLYGEDANEKKTNFSYQTTAKDSPETLLGVAAEAVSHLLEPLRYRLSVKSNESNGTVLVDGRDVGQLDHGQTTIEVSPGEHRFQLSAAKEIVSEQVARVPTEPLRLELDRTATSPLTHSKTPREVGTQRSPSAEEFDAKPTKGNPQRTWGYITLGAGGVLLASGVGAATWVYLLNQKENFRDYRSGIASNQDACTEADNRREVAGAMTSAGVRSLCSQASALEVAEVILLTGGVVAAGTGLTLLLTSKSSSSAATLRSIEPRVVIGRDRTNVGVLVHF